MQIRVGFLQRRLLLLAVCLAVIVMGLLASGCAPGSTAPAAAPAQAAQAGGGGWKVWRHDTFDKVWASIKDQKTLDLLKDSTKRSLWADGYVTTDSLGQGCLERTGDPACAKIWVFQKSGWGVGETISACEKGSTSASCSTASTALFKNCPVKVVTITASMRLRGTLVTIVDDHDQGVTLVIVHEGVADVEPVTQPDQPVALEAGWAAYFVSPEGPSEAVKQLTLPPATPIPLTDVVPLVEGLGFTSQVQRANMIVFGKAPIVPLSVPYVFALSTFDEGLSPEAAQEIAVGWQGALPWIEQAATPVMYRASLEPDRALVAQLAGPPVEQSAEAMNLDLRESPGSVDLQPLNQALQNAGYDVSQEWVILYDSDAQEALQGMAEYIADKLRSDHKLNVRVSAADLSGLNLDEWKAASMPVFLLTWY